MPKSKASAFFSVLIVFLSGAAMGAVGYRLYTVKSGANTPNVASAKKIEKQQRSPAEIRKRIVAALKDNIKLDDQQVSEVDKFYVEQFNAFAQVHDKYQAQINDDWHAAEHERDHIHDQYVVKIKAILRPDQQPLYDKWLADRAADRARHQQEHKDRPDGGKQRPLPPLPPLP